MEFLNYHHLHYFWLVAHEGSIARACEKLRVSPPTVSEQLRALEQSLGAPLFHREGRGLVLTDVGRTALRYADEIFSLGREFQSVIRGKHPKLAQRLDVGVSDAIPKLVAQRLLAPTLAGATPARLVCREGGADRLLTELSLHNLDVVLSDAPVNPALKIVAHSHLLGESDLTVVGSKALATKLRAGFPASLGEAPWLVATENVAVRRALDRWFEQQQLAPRVVAEFEDSALLKSFGAAGHGIFVVPTLVAKTVKKQLGVHAIGRIREVRERYYAITVERKRKHPAVLALCSAARERLAASAA